MANRITVNKTTIHVGDIIGVHQKIKEGDKERIQIFKGVVIAIKGRGTGKSFTVRRIASNNVGVERIWPVLCPSISKIEVVRRGVVRRAKLYYLREKVGREATRIKTKKEKKVLKPKNKKKKPGKPKKKPTPKKPSK